MVGKRKNEYFELFVFIQEDIIHPHLAGFPPKWCFLISWKLELYSVLDEEYFSSEAANVLEELTQGQMLQAQVVGRSEEGIPYVHIYQINGEKVGHLSDS